MKCDLRLHRIDGSQKRPPPSKPVATRRAPASSGRVRSKLRHSGPAVPFFSGFSAPPLESRQVLRCATASLSLVQAFLVAWTGSSVPNLSPPSSPGHHRRTLSLLFPDRIYSKPSRPNLCNRCWETSLSIAAFSLLCTCLQASASLFLVSLLCWGTASVAPRNRTCPERVSCKQTQLGRYQSPDKAPPPRLALKPKTQRRRHQRKERKKAQPKSVFV